tara:strand:- start:1 stop:822 length:822 start_codon:yes stop_codon:yes gene_type:complete
VKYLKALFDFYLDASVHVAVSVWALYFVTIDILGVQGNSFLALFILMSTIVCYNFVKYGVEADKYLIVSNRYHRLIQGFSFVCFGILVYSALHISLALLGAIAVLTVLAALYALPMWPNSNNLRSLGVLKIVVVALVWTGFTVLLPILDADLAIGWDAIILLVQRFLMVLVLMLPFEVRDMRYDHPAMKTVPQRFGVERTKKLGYVLTALYFLLTFLKDDVAQFELVGRFLVALALIWAMYRTKEEQSRYFAAFWVEAMPLFWLVVILVIGRY